MTSAAACAALVAGLGTGIASAVPGDDITGECLEMSFDEGANWLDFDGFVSVVDDHYDSYIPSPGDEQQVLEFDVRNACDVPAQFTIFSENWAVSVDGTATVRGAIDGQPGQQFVIGPNADATERIVLQEKPLPKGTVAGVAYILGIPANEEAQDYEISPGWGFGLEEVEAGTVAPEAPTRLTAGSPEVKAGTPVTISGSAEPGTTVTVTGGGESCTATADDDGAFACELTFDSAGAKSITATAENDNGTSAPLSI